MRVIISCGTDTLVDTEAIKAIVEEMARLKRERQDMEQPLADLGTKIQRCSDSMEELRVDFVR